MSYFQQQELLLEQLRTPKQLERYIGIVDRLSGNINLFVDKTDIEKKEYYIKYLALSTIKGPQNKLIFYGLYDTVQHVFHIHDGCRYNKLSIYSDIISRYNSYKGYITAGYISDNKIGEAMSKYALGMSKLIQDDNEYHLFKFVYSYHTDKINRAELYSVYSDDVIDNFNSEYPDYSTDSSISKYALNQLLRTIEDYEDDINFSGSSGKLFNVKDNASNVYQIPDIKDRVTYISNEFKYAMSRTDFFEYYQSPCPTIQECKDNETELCGIYYYGEGEYNERMPRLNEGHNIPGIRVDDDFEYNPSDYSFSDGYYYGDYDDEDDEDLL